MKIQNKLKEIVEYREELHQIPELGLKEFKTSQYIKKTLKDIGVEWFEVAETGVCVYYDFGNDNTIAFRADIDGLKIKENTKIQKKSQHEGYMHACGHDGHAATLLGLTSYIQSYINESKVNILIIFQPAEEGPGGAEIIVNEGIMNKYKVSEIYGFHVYPGLDKHVIGYRPGNFMAKSCEVDIKIKGQSCHAASPDEGIDSTLIASKMRVMMDDFIKELSTEEEPAVLSFGILNSGSARNIISNEAHLSGILRCFDLEVYKEIKEGIYEIGRTMEKTEGCKIDVNLFSTNNAVINDVELSKFLEKEIFCNYQINKFEKPFMLAEDFSAYQRVTRGVFFYLGTRDSEKGYVHPLHSEYFYFESEVLETGLKVFVDIINYHNKI